MPENNAQDKTEQPTPKRRQDARKKGEVARSQEVNTAFMLLAGLLMLMAVGPNLIGTMKGLSTEVFGNVSAYEINPNTLPGLSWGGALYIFQALLPFFAVMLAVGMAVNFGQVGIRVAEGALTPKWERLNLFKGFKQLFSKAPFELAKNLVKMLMVATVAFFVMRSHLKEFFLLGDLSVNGLADFIGDVGFELGGKVVIVVMLIAVVDYAYQRYRHTKDLKMTKQEVKEEHKQTEGDPQVKSRIRQQMQELSRSRMMQDVPEADVVITNPTHYAVAVKYEAGSMEAPKVVAKGMRKIAERIKEIARENDVPVVENPPLARSLYDLVDIGDEIPMKFYRAIAEILARIYQSRK